MFSRLVVQLIIIIIDVKPKQGQLLMQNLVQRDLMFQKGVVDDNWHF